MIYLLLRICPETPTKTFMERITSERKLLINCKSCLFPKVGKISQFIRFRRNYEGNRLLFYKSHLAMTQIQIRFYK